MLGSKAKIIPLFYQVEPWELRYIENGVYAEAFLKYEEKGRYLDKLKEWRKALQQVSYTAGYELKNSYDCKGVVIAVEKEVQRTKRLHVAKYPVGLHKIVKDFERRCLEELVQDFETLCGMKKAAREKANIAGIFGMGGVGKTTLSLELFNQKRTKYSRASFLFDVRETYARGNLPLLHSQLLKDLFCEGNHNFPSNKEGTSCLRDRLERNRSLSFLIFLDDIDHVEQLDALLPMDILNEHGNNDHLIIITTRDVGVLVSTGIDIAYHLRGLDTEDGRELFCWHAFNQPYPLSGYKDLVQEFVNMCGGLPLSLLVLGRHLFGRAQWYWEDELEKLKETLPGDIKTRLKISIDTLDNVEKQIFMDISCFFIGKSITTAMTIWKGSGRRARHALERLKEKCLVEEDRIQYLKDKWESSTEWFVLRMHDHLRDLGREMANELSHPRRVWHPQALKSLEPKGFRNILAQTEGRCFHSILDESISCNITYFLREPEDGSDTSLLWLQLEYLRYRAPLLNPVINSRIFSWVPVQNLQYLRISDGRFKNLWQSDVQAPLKRLQIRDTFLEEMPSLDRVSSLEQIEIRSCQKLQKITLPATLMELDVQTCKDLERVAGASDPTGLTRLIIKQCHALKELPSLARVSCLEKIEIDSCKMLQNIMLPRELISLSLQNCRDLQRVAGAYDITKLTLLIIKQCPALKEFPSLARVSCLKEIEIDSCEKLQNIILPRTLISLSVLNSKHLQRLEGTSGLNLTHLIIKQCPVLEEFPSLAGVNCLKEIMIDSWEKLQNITLPTTLIKLHVQSCRNLEEIAGIGDLTKLRQLIIKQCPALEELPSLAGLNCLEDIMIDSWEKLQNITLPTTLIKLHVQSCRNFERIAVIGDLTNLRQLIIKQCPALQEFPSIPRMSCLKEIEIASFEKLQNIMLPTTLMSLSVQSCRDLRRIEGTGDLRDLTHLMIINCPELEDLPNLSRTSRLMIHGISSCKKVQNVAGIKELNALQSVQLLYNSKEAIENCITRLMRMPSRRTDMIGRAADGAKSTLNESLFSAAYIDANAVTDIVTQTDGDVDFDFNYWWVKWRVMRTVVIGCFLVVVDSSSLVDDINKLLPDCYDYGFGVKVRQGEWIITIVAYDYSSYYYIHLISNVLRRYGVAKKGFQVEVNKSEEWKSVGVIQTIVDRLYHL